MKKKILIVDDDVSIGDMLQTLLEFNDFEAVVLNDPDKIEKKIEEQEPDLILLDMRLSGVSGTDVCAALKEEPGTKNIPIIMMSALSDADNTCLAAGANDFISKPFEMDELLAKIKDNLAT